MSHATVTKSFLVGRSCPMSQDSKAISVAKAVEDCGATFAQRGVYLFRLFEEEGKARGTIPKAMAKARVLQKITPHTELLTDGAVPLPRLRSRGVPAPPEKTMRFHLIFWRFLVLEYM